MNKQYRNNSETGSRADGKVETSVSLRLTIEDYIALKAMADDEDRSVSSLVRLLIRRACFNYRTSKPPSVTPS